MKVSLDMLFSFPKLNLLAFIVHRSIVAVVEIVSRGRFRGALQRVRDHLLPPRDISVATAINSLTTILLPIVLFV